MNTAQLCSPILIREYLKQSGGSIRRFGAFECLRCSNEFEGRIERIKVMTGLCKACANLHAGRVRAKYPKGEAQSRLHVTWANMKRRCLNPVGKEKTIYAGVKLCNEWMEYAAFRDWALENGYTDELTIDRKNSFGNYEPDNCRFVDYKTQSANRKKTTKNKSGYIGITFQSGAWRATVSFGRKQINIGRFSDIREAAIARNKYITENNLPHTLNELA